MNWSDNDSTPLEDIEQIAEAIRESGKSDAGEPCEVCGTFVYGFEYQGCCDGRECGCMGKPVEPCVCSGVCWDKLIKGNQ